MKRVLALALVLIASSSASAQPAIAPDAAVMNIDELGIYSVGCVRRTGEEVKYPLGWSGHFDELTGIACHPNGEQNGKRAFLLHPPWRNGTGVTYQEFMFNNPGAKRIVLRGATAMQATGAEKSDGVTFRIFVNSAKLLDVHRTDSAWREFSFDLSANSGPLTIRFETDPGPKDDPSFDFGVWGNRELVLEGFRPSASRHKDPPPLDLTMVSWWKDSPQGVQMEADGHPYLTAEPPIRPRMDGDTGVFTYAGTDGTLEYRWSRPLKATDPPLGTIVLRGKMTGDTPIEVPLATGAKIEWAHPARFVSATWLPALDSPAYFTGTDTRVPSQMALTYSVGDAHVVVVIKATLAGKRFMLDVVCNTPEIASIDIGDWGPVMRRRIVSTPYCVVQPQYLPAENLFVSTLLDWTASNATNQQGSLATYFLKTDGTRVALHERAIYTAAWHLAEVLPVIPNEKSPYIAKLADKIVLDNWGGMYTGIADGFTKLHDYGIDGCVALIHDWQRSGYDNALPAHLPAAADKGGDPGMKTLVETGTKLGYYVALHENYVDYYPNYDFFDEKDIALDSAGKRQLAWYNPGTRIQSFAIQPNAILRLAKTQSPEIHSRFGTNANYLDVHSAVPPWFHVDERASEPGASTFREVWNAHKDLWVFERKTHGGPVFGEGNNHAYWSGLLDGVEAQFGTGWPGGAGMAAPLMVDFDLLRIHPLQFNHGMGYYERWWSSPTWGARPPMSVLDQYRMQEVAYGHMGFLGGATWNDIPYAWLEHHLLTPVTKRYATQTPKSIRYRVKGEWVDGTAAAKAGVWKQVQTTYQNGLTVTCNDAEEPLTVGNTTLPRFGWSATGAGVTAWTALKDGVTADYAETAEAVFANARNAKFWNTSGLTEVRPTVADFLQTASRRFRVTSMWIVSDDVTESANCFVHFGKPGADAYDEGIKFQADHGLATPTNQWKRGQQVTDGPYEIAIPDNVPDGDYQWAIGLYVVGGGQRLSIEGVPDGHGRILLGTVRVSGNGAKVEFIPTTAPLEDRSAMYLRNLNPTGKVVDFGTVRTNGSIMVRREGPDWVLRALPRDREFTIELSAARFRTPGAVICDGGSAPTVKPGAGAAGFWSLTLNGAKTYRWKAR